MHSGVSVLSHSHSSGCEAGGGAVLLAAELLGAIRICRGKDIFIFHDNVCYQHTV